jgi:hypothetical protein
MAAVPWFTPVTSPAGVVGLTVLQDGPAATAGETQVEQVAPVEPLGHKEIVQERSGAVVPAGQVVVTVATDVSLELHVVVIG